MSDLRLPDEFEGPGLKITRAQRHLNAVNRLISKYQALNPYVIAYELNADKTLYEGRVIERLKPFPAFGILIGEFVYQLRSALDHIIYEFSAPNFPDTVPELRKAERVPEFPIFMTDPTAGGIKDFPIGHLKFVAQPVIDLVKAYQPYVHEGDYTYPHPLAVLEALNIRDKHRLVHPTAVDWSLRTTQFLPEGVRWKATSKGDHREVFIYVPAHLDPINDLGPDVFGYNLALHIPSIAAVHVGFLSHVYEFVALEMLTSFKNLVP